MSSEVIIYGLKDPETGIIRYVGKTKNSIEYRMAAHLNDRARTHKGHWIRELRARGLVPEPVVLEILLNCPEDGWQETERSWISILRFYGCPLTNLTEGGDGRLGVVHTPETLEKLRTKALGKKMSPEAVEKTRRAMIGRTYSPETIQKMRAAKLGKKPSEETRQKMRAAHLGKKMPFGHGHKVWAARRKKLANKTK